VLVTKGLLKEIFQAVRSKNLPALGKGINKIQINYKKVNPRVYYDSANLQFFILGFNNN